MHTVAVIAAFAIVAVALYLILSAVIARLDARYERRSAEARRKDAR